MYARSTTFRGDPGAVDGCVAYVRDKALPAVSQMDGCVGLSMLVDRSTGRCVVTTSWADTEAMHAGAEQIRPIRETVVRTIRGLENETEVVEWAVGVLHRIREAPPAAATRVIWARGAIGGSQHVIDAFRATIVPRVHDLPGFCSISLLTDDATGRYAITTTYDSRQTRSRAKGQAQAMREEFTEHMGLHVTEVAEFDLVLAHLRVRETV